MRNPFPDSVSSLFSEQGQGFISCVLWHLGPAGAFIVSEEATISFCGLHGILQVEDCGLIAPVVFLMPLILASVASSLGRYITCRRLRASEKEDGECLGRYIKVRVIKTPTFDSRQPDCSQMIAPDKNNV